MITVTASDVTGTAKTEQNTKMYDTEIVHEVLSSDKGPSGNSS